MGRSRDEKHHMKIQNIVLIWVTVLLLAGCATDTKDPQPATAVPATAVPATAVPATAVPATAEPAPTGVLKLEYLNDCRRFGILPPAVFDIRVTNRSIYLLIYWALEIEVWDASGKFLGSNFTNGTNLANYGNAVSQFRLSGVSCKKITHKKVSLRQITIIGRGGQTNSDAAQLFDLVVE